MLEWDFHYRSHFKLLELSASNFYEHISVRLPNIQDVKHTYIDSEGLKWNLSHWMNRNMAENDGCDSPNEDWKRYG